MELRQLRYFIALAEHLHFGRAAEAVFVSQSALSQQIQKLERELGALLVVRQVGRVNLTEAGHALLPRARRTLRQSELCYVGAADRTAHKDSVIRLSYPASVADVISRIGLGDFNRDWPGTRFELIECDATETAAQLASGDSDVAFTWLSLDGAPSGLESLTVCSMKAQVVFAAKHPLAQKPVIAWEELAEQTQVLFEKSINPPLYDVLRSPFRKLNVKALHVSPMSVNFWVSLGAGFSISSPEMDAALLYNPAIRIVPVQTHPLSMRIVAQYGAAKATPIVRRFIGFLQRRFVDGPAPECVSIAQSAPVSRAGRAVAQSGRHLVV